MYTLQKQRKFSWWQKRWCRWALRNVFEERQTTSEAKYIFNFTDMRWIAMTLATSFTLKRFQLNWKLTWSTSIWNNLSSIWKLMTHSQSSCSIEVLQFLPIKDKQPSQKWWSQSDLISSLSIGDTWSTLPSIIVNLYLKHFGNCPGKRNHDEIRLLCEKMNWLKILCRCGFQRWNSHFPRCVSAPAKIGSLSRRELKTLRKKI